MIAIHLDSVASPLGPVAFAAAGDRLVALDFREVAAIEPALARRFGDVDLVRGSDPLGVGARLAAYFGGALRALDDLEVDGGGSPFQRRVWALLRAIPPGTTRAYGDLARDLGDAGASRAVGRANATNPIAIVVPCHRVIGASAKLTGYAGGVDKKEWLLRHEGALPAGLF